MTSERAVLSLIGLVSLLALGLLGFLLMVRTPAAGAIPDVSTLPALNATLNGACALLLTAGFWCIRRRKIVAHMTCMLSASPSRSPFWLRT